jgi:oligopeptide transport system permease protein
MEMAAAIPKRAWRVNAAMVGGLVIAAMFVACIVSLPVTIPRYNAQDLDHVLSPPGEHGWMGTDRLGRDVLLRSLMGGTISLSIGLASAAISVIIGTVWGMVAGYAGGRVDAVLMRIVDILYGLPYILLVVLLKIAMEPPMVAAMTKLGAAMQSESAQAAAPLAGNVITLLMSIGVVSWLTLARVVRGQVLSLKHQPFVEAARAMGCSPVRVLGVHVLPNLVGPIIVYTTLTVPQAILQESFLSFLGIGVQAPLPSWGNMASDGLAELNPVRSHAWLLAWPCLLLGVTLLALNFLGDGLRDRYDPKSLKR